MKKTSIATVLSVSLLIVFASVPIAQNAEKGWKKTVTLPSGEVILDMSGEWDNHIEFYGTLISIQPIQDIIKFTQKGTTVIGAKQTASIWKPKGTETIKGELNKAGFKAVYSYIGDEWGIWEWAGCKWEISEDGNKIGLDCGERAKLTLTRK
jgi:hypothetical protein